MRRLITLAVLVAAAYYGYTVGLPYLRENFDLGGSSEAEEAASDAAWSCVSQARAAAATVSDQLRDFAQPPVDRSLWAAALVHTAGELRDADDTCRCGEPACRPAAQALTQARRLLNQFDRAVQGDGAGFSNPAVYREEIDRLLDNAEALLP